ncbi:hypothetical protein [Bradyrhizobium sp. HKCCYLR20261]|uniref:hypothetical protein n=1 Tax=Bradyrhizobium sp. HKCCYLR20261 TaxID=3420760 RepID=UPI003EB799C7
MSPAFGRDGECIVSGRAHGCESAAIYSQLHLAISARQHKIYAEKSSGCAFANSQPIKPNASSGDIEHVCGDLGCAVEDRYGIDSTVGVA